jgi:hypothetical protein
LACPPRKAALYARTALLTASTSDGLAVVVVVAAADVVVAAADVVVAAAAVVVAVVLGCKVVAEVATDPVVVAPSVIPPHAANISRSSNPAAM